MFKEQSASEEKYAGKGLVTEQFDLENLKRNFSGEIILPDDITYEQLSATFSSKGAPAAIVKPNDAADVAAAIQYVRRNSSLMSIRSGGHGSRGFATNIGGIVIDLSAINKIEVIDKKKQIVRIGAGALWGDVAKTLEEHHLAVSSGDTKSVGVGGLTLGGGIGWLIRKVGLTVDSLLAAEVVTADGSILRVSSEENPDLFWAIRGGGGNFCVVTNFEFAAHPLNKIVAGTIQYDISDLQNVLKGWRNYMRVAPEALNSSVRIMPPLFGNPAAAIVMFCHSDDDSSEVRNAIEPLLQLGKVVKQDIKEMNYSEILEDAMHPPETIKVVIKNSFVEDFNDELIQTITDSSSKANNMVLQIRSLGGVMNRISSDATAYSFRESEIIIVAGFLIPRTLTENEERIALKPWDSIKTFGKGAYVNFLSEDENIKNIYPDATYARLAEIKKVYDPDNIFNQNYNIKH